MSVPRESMTWCPGETHGDDGVRINSVSPGSIDTPMARRELEVQPGMHTLLEMTPIARLGTIQEVVSVVRFLTSEEATYITGTDVLVDGGALTALAGLLA